MPAMAARTTRITNITMRFIFTASKKGENLTLGVFNDSQQYFVSLEFRLWCRFRYVPPPCNNALHLWQNAIERI